jgi:hypothetical protein
MSARVLAGIGDPAPGSKFQQVNALYPYEKSSDWCRTYLTAALEHLLLWADYVAPLRFHPEQEVVHTFRPAHTLGRAAMEAASQAVWLTAGDSARECARRHLCLIRWDYDEHRKSFSDPAAKKSVTEMDALLVDRASPSFAADELNQPSHYSILRSTAVCAETKPDEIERVWRAASGSAHGRVWAALHLQHIVPLEEYEPGQYRTLRIPDADLMTEVLRIAERMTLYGVLRFADFSGADIGSLVDEAKRWLASVIPIREDADPEVVARFTATPSGRVDEGGADAATSLRADSDE